MPTLIESDRSFRIVFADTGCTDHLSDDSACVSLTLDNAKENVECSLIFWTREEYRHHWKSELQHVLNSRHKGALITSMVDPVLGKYVEWWPMWRLDDEIVLRNQLLFLDSLEVPLNIQQLDRYVGVRDAGEGEYPVSEWRVPIKLIEEFLQVQPQDR